MTNACFAYPSAPTTQVLHDLSFTVQPGQTVAFVGHSGCGKSTINNLLMRYYQPTKGSVMYDGIDSNDYNLEWLRGRIGLVAQQPPLLPTTIRGNVAIGKRGATEEEIIKACKAANAHNFIMEFPQQYDTEVGENGSKLSGGQRQRIAIASVMISNPNVLILDEATSALDSVSEAQFQKVLSATRDERSTVCIAHRLSTIRDADEIIVLDHGRVVERGNHDTLVAKKGQYYAMLHAQDDDKATGALGDGTKSQTGNSFAPNKGWKAIRTAAKFGLKFRNRPLGGKRGTRNSNRANFTASAPKRQSYAWHAVDAMALPKFGSDDAYMSSQTSEGCDGGRRRSTMLPSNGHRRRSTMFGMLEVRPCDGDDHGDDDYDEGVDDSDDVGPVAYSESEFKHTKKWTWDMMKEGRHWFWLALLGALFNGMALPIAYTYQGKIMVCLPRRCTRLFDTPANCSIKRTRLVTS